MAHGISRRRAEIAADRPGGSDEKEVHLPDGNQISGEGHDDLGRKRDAGGFDRHHEDNAEEAQVGNRGHDEGRKQGDEMLKQAGLLPSVSPLLYPIPG